MNRTAIVCSIVSGVLVGAAAEAQAPSRPGGEASPDTPGTGPFPAVKLIEPGLSDQVVYRPDDLDRLGDTRLGVYVFGNGGCSDDAASSRLHLLEVASHGYLAIAPGGIHSGPDAVERPAQALRIREAETREERAQATRPQQLAEAIDWALAMNAEQGSAYYGLIDPGAIAVSGFSCGGLQALLNARDARVDTAVIMNSGVLNDEVTRLAGMETTKAVLGDLHFPTLYVLGGPSDIAYENGMDDYRRIDHVPVAVANIDKGHGGTYNEPNGGAAARVVVNWLEWTLRDDAGAAAMFLGEDCGLCNHPEWTFEKKRLD